MCRDNIILIISFGNLIREYTSLEYLSGGQWQSIAVDDLEDIFV